MKFEVTGVRDGSRGSATDREQDLGVLVSFTANVDGKAFSGEARVAPRTGTAYGGALRAFCHEDWFQQLRREQGDVEEALAAVALPAAQAFATERGWRIDGDRWTGAKE